MSNLPSHVYLNLDATNTSKTPQPLVFNDMRNNPFIENADQYHVSIVRFSVMTGSSLPIFIPTMEYSAWDGTAYENLNTTIYNLTLQYGSINVTVPLVYNTTNRVSNPALLGSSISNGYTNENYYIYYYQQVVDMVNQAFVSAFAQLGSLISPTIANATIPPLMQWDTQNNKAIILAELGKYDRNLMSPILIYFNTSLYELFSSTPADGVNTSELYKNYCLKFYNNTTNLRNVKYLNVTTYTMMQVFQEVSTVQLWSPVQNILFTTDLPICPTNMSPPKNLSDPNGLTTTGENSLTNNVLTDIELAISGDNSQYRPYLLYNPTSEYRLFDIISGNNLNRIKLSCYWTDKYGNQIPLLFFLILKFT